MTARVFAAARKNLFSSPLDALLSLLAMGIVFPLLYLFSKWIIVTADWSVVTENIRFLMAGSLDVAQIWRAWLAGDVFLFMVALSIAAITRARRIKPATTAACLLTLAAIACWAAGVPLISLNLMLCLAVALGWLVSARVRYSGALLSLGWVVATIIMWNILIPGTGNATGGLLLGILVTLVAAVFSFPLGVLLALGRTSRLPGVRITCVVYIELIRSLPLISILYWAWMVVPLILPGSLRIDDLVRGAIGFTFFYAAYVAEYIRGGLQGIPEGQWNAARSLGLRPFSAIYYIVLPQAIRSVLPGLVGNVLDIFNNVPLLFIIGLTEFVRAGQVLLSNPQHSAQMYEVYVFMFVVYLLIATLLSWSSRVVEKNLSQAD